jgi:hypothetical protein
VGVFEKLFSSSKSDSNKSVSSSPALIEIKSRVRETCAWTNQYRKEFPLTEIELSFSYCGFVMWYLAVRGHENSGAEGHFIAANETARVVALEMVHKMSKHPSVVAEARKFVPNLDVVHELEWGAEKIDNPQWHVSFTRGVILGCRALAYSTSEHLGFMQPLGSQLFGAYVVKSRSSQLASLSGEWLSEFFTTEAVNKLNHTACFLARCAEGS